MSPNFAKLVELITLLSSKKLALLDSKHKKKEDTYIMKLYKGILSGQFKNDRDAAQSIYNSTANTARYQELSKRLNRQLLKQILLIDPNKTSFSDLQIAYCNSYRDIATMSILTVHAAELNAIAVAERAINTAIKYELTNVILILANKLEAHYSTKNLKKYQQYVDMNKKYEQIQAAERKATQYKRRLTALHMGKQSHDDTHLAEAMRYEAEMEALLQTFDSRTFLLYAYLIIAMRYEIANDYEKVILICDQAIATFKAKAKKAGIAQDIASFVFLYKKVVHYTTLKKYKKASEAAQECLNYIKAGGNNWYKILEECVTLSFHTKDYEGAYAFLKEAVNHPKYAIKSKPYKQRWMLYKAYIIYFIMHYSLGIPIEASFKRENKKFIRHLPLYDKDRWDNNASILLVHILFFSKAKEYDIVTSRVEELKKYFHKNLVKGPTFRVNCLCKMLDIMVKAQYNKTATIRKSEDLLRRLRAHPLEKSKQASNVEIVPYEDIWDCVLDNLETDYWHDLKK